MTHQELLNNFDEFSKDVFRNNIPKSNIGITNQIENLKAYLEDIPTKIKIINSLLTNEVNRILSSIDETQSIDVEKLKNDLIEIAHKNKDVWLTEHKPR